MHGVVTAFALALAAASQLASSWDPGHTRLEEHWEEARRGLATLQHCGEQNGSWAHWVISCGGNAENCTAPYCPAGYTTDPDEPKCALGDWEAPFCIPWTFWVRVYAGSQLNPTVDTPFPVVVQAFSASWHLSVDENRALTLVQSGLTGSSRQYSVSMYNGEGSVNITHTVAEWVHLRLAGNYGSFVDMGDLDLTFSAGATTRYVFTSATLHGSVDWPVQVYVEARDQYNNLATNEQRGLWIAFNGTKVQVLDFADGVGTALVRSQQPGALQVSLADPAHPSADVSDVMVVHFAVGVPAQFVFVGPSGSTFVAGSSVPITVEAQDQFGNLVVGENRGVTVVTNRGTGGGRVTFTSGQAVTTIHHHVAEPVLLSLRDHWGTGLDISSTLTIRYVAGPAFYVALEASSTTVSVGTIVNVAVKALDPYLNLAVSANQAVQVQLSGTHVTGGGTVTFVQGQAAVSVQSQIVQTVQVSLSDLGTGLDTSATLDLDFVPGGPVLFKVEGPSSATVGSFVTLTVKALDQHGNIATSASSSVTVRATGSAVLSNNGVAILSAGLAEVTLQNTRAEQVVLTLQDAFSSGLDVSDTSTLVFLPGPATRYAFAASQLTIAVDSPADVAVHALDQYGNVASNQQADIGVRTGSGGDTTRVDISAGQGSLQVSHSVTEVVTLTLVDMLSTGLDITLGGSLKVHFVPIAGEMVTLQASATSGTVDAPLEVTLRVVDRYGNLAASESRAVELRAGGLASLGVVDFVEGQGKASIYSTHVGSLLVTLHDSFGTGLDCSATLSLSFSHGIPTRVVLEPESGRSVGEVVTVTLTSLDQYGNEAPTAASLTLRASGSATVLDNGIVHLQSGHASADVRSSKAGSVALTMEDTHSTGLDLTDSKVVVFVAAQPTRLGFAHFPTQVSVDAVAEVPVHSFDEFGNVATAFQAQIGVLISGEGTPQLVDIVAGSGVLQVTRTVPEVLALQLVDGQGTGLVVDDGVVNLTFVPGAAQVILLQPTTATSTVDVPLRVELVAVDRYNNVASGEGGSVEVHASGEGITNPRQVDLVLGRGHTFVSSELAETVEVTLHDVFNTGIDCTASSNLVFGHGALHSFRLTSASGISHVVTKVGRSVTARAEAVDQFDNLVSSLPVLEVSAEIEPPPDGTSSELSWVLTGGIGSKDILISSAGVFHVQITEVEESSPGGQLTTAVLAGAIDRAGELLLDLRHDLVPPEYDSLKVSDLAATEVTLVVNGLTEPATVWCLAAAGTAGPPWKPGSMSDGAVYTALRGPEGNASSAPATRAGPLSTSGELKLSGLEASQTYLLRCAAADEEGNHMSGERILEHQLVVTTPEQPGEEEAGPSPMLVVGIIAAVVGVLLCCFAVAFLLRAQRTLEKVRKGFKQIVPVPWESGEKPLDAVVPTGGRSAANCNPRAATSLAEEMAALEGNVSPSTCAVEERGSTSSQDEDSLSAPGEDEEGLLRDALEMQRELVDELNKRGVLDSEADGVRAEDYDSSDSDDTDTEAILRDVKAFLRQQQGDPSAGEQGAKEPPLVLPDLPLLLSSDDEARLAALIALGQQDGPAWEQRLSHFDELWANVSGPDWKQVRSAVRAEMLERHEQLQAAGKRLAEAKAALVRHTEAREAAVLDALAAEEETISAEADSRLRTLHQLAVDWPEEDASQRNALIADWVSRITQADSLPRGERAQQRKEAVDALRKLTDDREEALEAELDGFESASANRFEAVQEERAEAWRQMCEKADAQAAQLREEVARLRLQVATLRRQAEEAALQAALQLRRRLRDVAIEAEMAREAEERERQLAAWRASVEECLAGSSEEDAVALRERALATLERAGAAARKAAADEQARRKRHWHEILEERSRDRLKAARRRYHEEERRLADEASQAQEEASEADARRRAVLVLGALHRAEAAQLTVAASARRGLILMGLQATAAGSLAEERLPRREAAPGSERHSDQEAQPSMANTGERWQEAETKAAEELNNALDQVAELLSEHGQRQRMLLAQRQRREASLADAAEGDDERLEDLLDALEENMRRELRASRWKFQGEAVESLARRGAGEESELGRRLAAVARDSQLLSVEDEIGERYDRLRAKVMGPSAEEEYAVQRKARQLEREAAALRAEARHITMTIAADPQSAWSGSPSQGGKAAKPMEEEAMEESGVEAIVEGQAAQQHRLEGQLRVRTRRRQAALQQAHALRDKGSSAEALSILEAAVQAELDDDSTEESAEHMVLAVVSVSEKDGHQKEGAAQRHSQAHSLLKARQAADLKRALELKSRGRQQDAIVLLTATLQEAEEAEGAGRRPNPASSSQSGGADEHAELAAELPKSQEAQLATMEAEHRTRRQQREDARRAARDLEAQGKFEEAVALLSAAVGDGDVEGQEVAGENDTDAAGAGRHKERKAARQRAKELIASGDGKAAVAVMVALLDEEEAWDSEKASRLRQMVEEERNKIVGACAEGKELREEALARDIQAQRARLEERRKARQQRRQDAKQEAADLEAQGKLAEAVALVSENLASDGAEEEDAEHSLAGAGAVDWAALREDLAKRQDHINADMASAHEAQRSQLEKLRAERNKRRQAARLEAAELVAQGKAKVALDMLVTTLGEEAEASDSEEAIRSKLSEHERKRLMSAFAEGKELREEALAKEGEVHRQNVEARRLARQQRREEAERKAAELERQAAELRASSATKAANAAGGSTEDFDAIAEWQEAARRRAAAGAVAASCQRGQENAARRLLDASEVAGDRSTLKDAFAAEMQRCEAAVASEREVQRRRAKERLEARRQRREAATREPPVRQASCTAAWRKAVKFQIHGVHGLQKLHRRRRARVLEELRDTERRVRAEVDSEMKALRSKLQQALVQPDTRNDDAQSQEVAVQQLLPGEDDAQSLRKAEVAKATEAASQVQDLVESERQRQAERVEARLAERKRRLLLKEVSGAMQQEARVELEHERERLQAKPVAKANNKRLVKELNKVNNIIASIRGNPAAGSVPTTPTKLLSESATTQRRPQSVNSKVMLNVRTEVGEEV